MPKQQSRPRSHKADRSGASKTTTAITKVEYSGLQNAFDHFNRELFGGQLCDVFIVYQRKPHSAGHFAPDRFAERTERHGKRHELSLNPDGFYGESDEQVCQTLVHEMTHLWQHIYGKPSKGGYHNKEWAAKMKGIGLYPSNTGKPGGKETGQQMMDYIIEGGPFTTAFVKLAASGWRHPTIRAATRIESGQQELQDQVHLPQMRLQRLVQARRGASLQDLRVCRYDLNCPAAGG
jgi:hypothetical protein